MTIEMTETTVNLAAHSVDAICRLLGTTDAWTRHQCVDKNWWQFMSAKNIKNNSQSIKLRFVKRSHDCYVGRMTFAILVGLVLIVDCCTTGTDCVFVVAEGAAWRKWPTSQPANGRI